MFFLSGFPADELQLWMSVVPQSDPSINMLSPWFLTQYCALPLNYALFLFKPSWQNPGIHAINSACVEVEQLAVWYCPGGFCICGFSLIAHFSKGLCVSPSPLIPPGLCREKCGMWGWRPLPHCAFEPLLWGLFIESFWGKKVTGELWCQVQNKTAAISLDTVPLKCQIVNFLRGRMSFLGNSPGVKESKF